MSEKMRSELEAWFKDRGVWPRLTYEEIWQAAYLAGRESMKEEAAKVCDRIAGNDKDFDKYTRRTAGMCAVAIRGIPNEQD